MDTLFSKLGPKDVESLRKKLKCAEQLQYLEKEKKECEKRLKDINNKIKQVKNGEDVDINIKKEKNASTNPAKKKASTSSTKKNTSKSPPKEKSKKNKNVEIPEDLSKNKKITVKLLKTLLAQNDVYFKTASTKKDLLALVIQKRLKTKLKSMIS